MTAGIPCFIAFCIIELHKCCVFYKLKAKLSTSIKIMTHFMVVDWHQTHNLSEVCLNRSCIETFCVNLLAEQFSRTKISMLALLPLLWILSLLTAPGTWQDIETFSQTLIMFSFCYFASYKYSLSFLIPNNNKATPF